jgi:hypothetical protein
MRILAFFSLKYVNLANCFCMFLTGTPTILYDSSKNRYARYAECASPVSYQGVEYDNTIDVCKHVSPDINYEAPGYILSKEKELYVESRFFSPLEPNLAF